MKESSTILRKYPTYRDETFKSCQMWIESKRLDDNAEGLWRVHDKLYDLKSFIKKHPGGSGWIEMTEGIDITEQFETHHISNIAEEILKKYYVREASQPRNYKITFDSKGFYKTLKRRVENKLKKIDTKSQCDTSKLYCDMMLATTLLSFILASRVHNFVTMIIASICLMLQTSISHNFIHQKDNWRMYLSNFSMQNFREWRVFHAMSHHMYPNSFSDLESSFFEPFLNWHPKSKSIYQKYGSIIISPLVYCFIYPGSLFNRITGTILYNGKLYWDDLLPLLTPLIMFAFGNSPFFETFTTWFTIIVIASFFYGLMANNLGHHHTEVFHDNDELKSLDFGIYQLAATFDKAELASYHFFTLTTFGHHVLHHMFPTLDHAVLPQLREIFFDTCKEFEADFKVFPWFELLIGQFNQLKRTEPRRINNNL